MKLKTKLKISQIFAVIFFVFWQIETWYFIGKDGWHWKAVSEAEKTCDGIVSLLITVSFVFFFSILYDIVKMFADANISSVSITKNDSGSKY